MTQPASGEPLVEFLADMRRMRAECDWKRAQTHRSLARYLLEETHETLEVLDAWDDQPDAEHLCEELGDLLLQVYFHAAIAEENGDFSLDDVARGIATKMRRRNPHVFGESRAQGADEINDQWQAIKAEEPVRSGLPPALPALLLADKVLERLERASGQPPAVAGEAGDDLGDRLLALVAEARAEGIDAEQSLRDAVRRLVGEQ